MSEPKFIAYIRERERYEKRKNRLRKIEAELDQAQQFFNSQYEASKQDYEDYKRVKELSLELEKDEDNDYGLARHLAQIDEICKEKERHQATTLDMGTNKKRPSNAPSGASPPSRRIRGALKGLGTENKGHPPNLPQTELAGLLPSGQESRVTLSQTEKAQLLPSGQECRGKVQHLPSGQEGFGMFALTEPARPSPELGALNSDASMATRDSQPFWIPSSNLEIRDCKLALKVPQADGSFHLVLEADVDRTLVNHPMDDLYRYIHDRTQKTRWSKMTPMDNFCIVHRVISISMKGQPPTLTSACSGCVGTMKRRVKTRRGTKSPPQRSRPCALLQVIEGQDTMVFLPLPEDHREGRVWTEVGYWIEEAQE